MFSLQQASQLVVLLSVVASDVVAPDTDLAEIPAPPGIAVELVVDDVSAAPSGVYSARFVLAQADSVGSTLPVHVVVWVAPARWVAVAVIEVVAATRPSVAASAPSFSCVHGFMTRKAAR